VRNLRLVSRYVRSMGHVPLVATSGVRALELLATDPIDLVLLDLVMSDMSGFEVLDILRERADQRPVLVLTALDDVRARVRALEKGAWDVVAKPFDRAELAVRIKNLVQLHEAREEAERARKALEENLQKAQKMEALGRLIGGIAHDFNNVIAAITNYASFLSNELDAADPRRDDALEVLNAAERGTELTRQLLAYARHQPVVLKARDVFAAIDSVKKLLSRTLGARISLDIQRDEGAAIVLAGPAHLDQVLLNLCVNARDAMPRGGRITIVAKRISLAEPARGVAAGDYVELSVSDTGKGIDAETCALIFEPFFTTKEEGSGTGLGLATSRSIVVQLGGVIHVESRVGEGTRFTVLLPLCDAARAREAESASALRLARARTHTPSVVPVAARDVR